MVGNVTIQGQIVGTATFDGAKISAVVTIAPQITATVIFGKSGVTVHNELTGRDAVDVHPKESITDLTITDSPEFANTQITTLDSVENGGVIPNVEANWLGATAKSVLSYLQKLVSKVFAIDTRLAIQEGAPVILTGNPIAWNASTSRNVITTLTINSTLNITNAVAGSRLSILLIQDATGSRKLVYSVNVKFPAGRTPVLSTTANSQDLLEFYVKDLNNIILINYIPNIL